LRGDSGREGDSAVSPGVAPALRPAGLIELEELLAEDLDTRVSVSMTASRGRIVIEFADLEDLERIVRHIAKPGTDEQ
jgi:ParB family chromosome partitioning protein